MTLQTSQPVNTDPIHTAFACTSRLATAHPQTVSPDATGASHKQETLRRLQMLYDKRIALTSNIAKEQERCRFAHDNLRAMKSDLARLEGNLAEIQAILREE